MSSIEPLYVEIDWPAFLRRHDLVWDSLPGRWLTGAFLGNGFVGAMVFAPDDRQLRIRVSHTAVTEHPTADNPDAPTVRLPLGALVLAPVGRIAGGDLRLDLWNAEARGTVRTDRGEIAIRVYVHAERPVMVVELAPTPGEAACQCAWEAARAVNPRCTVRGETPPHSHPEPITSAADGITVCRQPLFGGGDHATALAATAPTGARTVFLAVAASYPQTGSNAAANAAVVAARTAGTPALTAAHRAWWHAYYPASFVTIPDARFETFYWVQMYKLGSACRADSPPMDNMGPWFNLSGYPAIWWNLNLQLCYWPVYAANRLELGKSLLNALQAGFDTLCHNVPAEYRHDSAAIGRVSGADCRSPIDLDKTTGRELGNLTWTCHNVWLHYRHCLDDSIRRDLLFPLLRRAVNLYLHLLVEDNAGRLHLPRSVSPEYYREAADCTYDLALLRWGCETLLTVCADLSIDDPLIARWRDVLDRLVDFHTDDRGLMVGAGVPFDSLHRHYSHLFPIHPLHLWTWDNPEHRDLIARSVDNWLSVPLRHPHDIPTGFTQTGAASMYLLMGRPDEALARLNHLLDDFVPPSTIYVEADQYPVIETPLSAAQVIHEMLLQSHGGTLRIFPGLPTGWRDAVFHNLRAEGAFLVSAARRHGRTEWVRIESLAGAPCRVETDLPQAVDGTIVLDLAAGESALLLAPRVDAAVIAPVTTPPAEWNYYGSRAIANYATDFGGYSTVTAPA